MLAEGDGLVAPLVPPGVPPGVPVADGVALLPAPGVSNGGRVGAGGVVSSGSEGALGGGGTYCGMGGSAAAEAVTVSVLCSPITSMNVGPRSRAISLPFAS